MCFSPITIKNPRKVKSSTDSYTIEVPCGRCLECRHSQANQWKFRILEEWNKARLKGHCFFVTLTFDEEHLPKGNGIREFQNFMKRLRRRNPNLEVRYFAVNEVGSENFRLHFHVIFFTNLKCYAYKFYFNYLSPAWKSGWIDCKIIKDKKVASYVTDYCLNNFFNPRGVRYFVRLSSRREAIGKCYLTPKMIDFIRSIGDGTIPYKDERTGEVKYRAIPKYYMKFIFDENELYEIGRKREEKIKEDIKVSHDEDVIFYNSLCDADGNIPCDVPSVASMKERERRIKRKIKNYREMEQFCVLHLLPLQKDSKPPVRWHVEYDDVLLNRIVTDILPF